MPDVQGANAESRRFLQDIETHDVYDPSLMSGKPATNDVVYPFALHQHIDHESETLSDCDISSSIEEKQRNHESVGRRGRRRSLKKYRSSIASQDDFYTTDSLSQSDPDFEVLKDNLEHKDAEKMLSLDEKFKYGNADPQIPPSTVPCSGCGAHLQCHDTKFPGFIPVELFSTAKSDSDLREMRCQRCYIMKKYDVALKVTVSPEDYPKTIAHLKEKRAIVIIIVDLTDFPGSVWPDILNELGANKQILLVGNKVDLLPADSKYYLKRIEQSMVKTFKEKCLKYQKEHSQDSSGAIMVPEIVKSLLVSARTGYNVEVLIDKIYTYWHQNHEEVGGDVYLIGTTNVGKSSLFNMLVDSDLCKISARDRVNKAMISTVPGTTLNLLKFPIIRPDPSRLSQRRLRLQKQKEIFRKSETMRIEKLRKTRDRKYSILGFPVGRTFDHNDKRTVFSLDNFHMDHVKKPKWDKKIKSINPEDLQFNKSNWCYDTPGSVSADQLINILTQEELRKTIPHSLPIQPRSFILTVGQSLFLGGLGRFDVLEGPNQFIEEESATQKQLRLLLTVFAADELPVHVVLTQDADSFYAEALAADILAAPSTSHGTNIERLKHFPELEGEIMMIDGIGKDESSCDIVFSSAGWISCTPGVAQIFKVKAWTPGGRGLTIRDPPFLPEAVQLKGPKIKYSPAFKHGKVFVESKTDYGRAFK